MNRKWMFGVIAALVIVAPVVVARVGSTREGRTEARVERGRYLVSIMGCHDCHTPWKMGANGPEPDMTRALSGHPEGFAMTTPPALTGTWLSAGAATNTAYAGPWGISYTANLTPDQNTGSGSGPKTCSSTPSGPAVTWACPARSRRRCRGPRTATPPTRT